MLELPTLLPSEAQENVSSHTRYILGLHLVETPISGKFNTAVSWMRQL